jgi:hypothetical protein
MLFDLHREVERVDRHGAVHVLNGEIRVAAAVLRGRTARPYGIDDIDDMADIAFGASTPIEQRCHPLSARDVLFSFVRLTRSDQGDALTVPESPRGG